MEHTPPIKSITYNAINKMVKKQFIKEHVKEKNKKRVESENWTFASEYYNYEHQLNMIKDILSNNFTYNNDVSKIAIQQINRKIYGYKQQDLMKNHFNQTEFITAESIIHKMVDCELKCYYCSCEMNVLYDISREMKQWTVDRIDNDLGHNLTNYYLACLECNLKRRRRSDDKFLFTKQMKLVKIPGENNVEEKKDTSLV
jgi:hypothetical protein